MADPLVEAYERGLDKQRADDEEFAASIRTAMDDRMTQFVNLDAQDKLHHYTMLLAQMGGMGIRWPKSLNAFEELASKMSKHIVDRMISGGG
jgi:hypothetical protein